MDKACVLVCMEHLTGDVAIKEVRSRYCKHAIELTAQEELIHKYARKLAEMKITD